MKRIKKNVLIAACGLFFMGGSIAAYAGSTGSEGCSEESKGSSCEKADGCDHWYCPLIGC